MYNIYCLSFNGSERDKRMKERFKQLELNVEFQEPIKDEKLGYYCENSTIQKEWPIASIVVSFLEMFKKFLNSDKEYGIFCQDDIFIRKTFKQDLGRLLKFVEKLYFKSILLSYLIPCDPKNYGCNKLYEIDDDKYSLYDYHDELWGSQMFLLNRYGVEELLYKYDKPFVQNTIIADDHTFTKMRPRLMLYKMLACEEGIINSDHEGQRIFHQNCLIHNYSKDEFI